MRKDIRRRHDAHIRTLRVCAEHSALFDATPGGRKTRTTLGSHLADVTRLLALQERSLEDRRAATEQSSGYSNQTFTRTRSLVLSEQLEAHRLPAFVFDREVARHGSRADVEWMRLARPPIGERSELQSRAIELRLVSDDDGGAGGGRNACKFSY